MPPPEAHFLNSFRKCAVGVGILTSLARGQQRLQSPLFEFDVSLPWGIRLCVVNGSASITKISRRTPAPEKKCGWRKNKHKFWKKEATTVWSSFVSWMLVWKKKETIVQSGKLFRMKTAASSKQNERGKQKRKPQHLWIPFQKWNTTERRGNFFLFQWSFCAQRCCFVR